MNSSFDFLRSPEWRKSLVATAFGKSFWGFLLTAIAFGVLCWVLKGRDVVLDAFAHDLNLLLNLLPRVFVAIGIAALIWVLLPRDKVSSLVGRESGLKGLAIATAAGTITPGGPSSAYSLLAVLAVSGADRGALIAYITAWATLAVQRILIWDVPFMGAEFAMLRFGACLALPVVAGLIARQLPMDFQIRSVEDTHKPREAKT